MIVTCSNMSTEVVIFQKKKVISPSKPTPGHNESLEFAKIRTDSTQELRKI